jgi:hypothetical protein
LLFALFVLLPADLRLHSDINHRGCSREAKLVAFNKGLRDFEVEIEQ